VLLLKDSTVGKFGVNKHGNINLATGWRAKSLWKVLLTTKNGTAPPLV